MTRNRTGDDEVPTGSMLAYDAQRAGAGLTGPFLADHNLVRRLELDAALNPADESMVYGGTDAGYIDYPGDYPGLGESA